MSILQRPAAAPQTAGRSSDGDVVVVEGLVKTYGEFRAVAGLDLRVGRGEVFGLLGPNGAGKTTTIDLLVGLRRPSAGSVRILGLDPAADRAALTARVAVQPQEASLYDTLSVAETLRLFASLHTAPRPVAEIAERIGLADQAGVRVKRLSGGQRRRLLLGVALIGDPELVVLDEPSAGLDPAARQSLWSLIASLRERGTTVVVTTHHMDEASVLCDRVAIVVDGAIVAVGAPEELVRQRSAHRRVSFTLPLEAAPDALLAHPGVVSLETSPGADEQRVEVVTSDSDDLIAHLTTAGWRPRDLTVATRTLEDVFLALAETSDYESRSRGTKRKGRKNR
ncbi:MULTISPECIES: ABC transporter ATP-binding protein [unclassified Rathayibacter]|jgi:ABC-2 type transport system ATP-binding protein|uniref:ABC transporter ATP-binding protein n=1 Tax=unclassified Rathayibacter TaxID=2609250 RepID=UPI000CE7E069|nr:MULTISPECIES: ABC transporter ATP-binding protein [unclassified Rathayibacter]PPG50057.1 ABC transporter ATP-binding protein [Rathayibacter sp. AY2B3]PPI20893.1 ABC transporter ATP-binding protein [Rathayibacter sp. AY1B6]PPI20980.1 ABC transporter ATP-binding protein [Rathayibacter sp. AY1B5]PPI38114.1 ABC transporter ATP-binding protein [Rathayibacter sp. AY1B1]